MYFIKASLQLIRRATDTQQEYGINKLTKPPPANLSSGGADGNRSDHVDKVGRRMNTEPNVPD